MDRNMSCSGRSRLEEAIRRYEYTHYSAFPEENGEIVYSQRYLKKMHSLCKKSRALFFPVRNAVGKRAAAIILTAVLLMTGMFTASAEARRSFAEWFTNVYEYFTEIFSSEHDISHAPKSVETIYLPTALPQYYFLSESYISQGEAKTSWRNHADETIIFIQTPLHSKTTVDSENVAHETFYLDGIKYLIVKNKRKNCIYWNGKDYAFTLIIPDTLSQTEYEAIISSVRESDAP